MKQINQTALFEMLLDKLSQSKTPDVKSVAQNKILQMIKEMQERERKMWSWVCNATDNLIELSNENKRIRSQISENSRIKDLIKEAAFMNIKRIKKGE